MAELLARVNFPGKSTPLVIADAILTPARIALGYENITYVKSESASQDKKFQIVQAEKVKNVALRGLVGVVAYTILLIPTLIALLVKYAFIGPQNEFLSKQGKTAESTQKTAENRLPPKPPGDAKLDEKKAKEPNSVVHPTPPSSKPTSQSEPRAHAPSAQPAKPIVSENSHVRPITQKAIDEDPIAAVLSWYVKIVDISKVAKGLSESQMRQHLSQDLDKLSNNPIAKNRIVADWRSFGENDASIGADDIIELLKTWPFSIQDALTRKLDRLPQQHTSAPVSSPTRTVKPENKSNAQAPVTSSSAITSEAVAKDPEAALYKWYDKLAMRPHFGNTQSVEARMKELQNDVSELVKNDISKGRMIGDWKKTHQHMKSFSSEVFVLSDAEIIENILQHPTAQMLMTQHDLYPLGYPATRAATSVSVPSVQTQGPSAAPARVETKTPLQSLTPQAIVMNLYKMLDEKCEVPREKLRELNNAEWHILIRDYKKIFSATHNGEKLQVFDSHIRDRIWYNFESDMKDWKLAYPEAPSLIEAPSVRVLKAESKASSKPQDAQAAVISWYKKTSDLFNDDKELYNEYLTMIAKNPETEAIVRRDYLKLHPAWTHFPEEKIKQQIKTSLQSESWKAMQGWEQLYPPKDQSSSISSTQATSVQVERAVESKRGALKTLTDHERSAIDAYKEFTKPELDLLECCKIIDTLIKNNSDVAEIIYRDYRTLHPHLSDQRDTVISRFVRDAPRSGMRNWKDAYKGYNLGE